MIDRRADPRGAWRGALAAVDLGQWLWEEFRIVVAKQTLSRESARWAFASSRPGRGIMRNAAPSRILKNFPGASGRDRRREGPRPRPDRDLVRRRGPHRPEEQDHPPLGAARHPTSAPHDQRTASTYIFGAVCPKEGKGAALVLPACNTEAMNLHLAEIATEVAPGRHAVLLLDQAGWHLSRRSACRPTSPSCRCRRSAPN